MSGKGDTKRPLDKAKFDANYPVAFGKPRRLSDAEMQRKGWEKTRNGWCRVIADPNNTPGSRIQNLPMVSMQLSRMTKESQREVLTVLEAKGLSRGVKFDHETGEMHYRGGYLKQRQIGEALGLEQTK